MGYYGYGQDDDRPDDDWDEEKIEHFYQLWLFEKAMAEYAEENANGQAAVTFLKVAPTAAPADPFVW